jgi:DNA-binding LytR/AlgR family response regulator
MFASRPEQSAVPPQERMPVQSFIHLRERVLIGSTEAFVLIEFNDLLRCEALGTNSLVVTRDGREYLVSESLGKISQALPSDLFARPTSVHLVLREAVRSVTAERISLENGFEIRAGGEVARDEPESWNKMVNWKTQISKVLMALW